MSRRHYEVRHGARSTTVPMTEAESLRLDVKQLRAALQFFKSYPNTHEAQSIASEALRATEQ